MQDGGARHAIPTDDAYLDAAAIGSARDDRNDGVLWKDDVVDRLIRLSEHVAPLQLDHLKVGLNDDGQMRKLRHGSLPVLGREYTSLSAACGPDQSTSNKQTIK